MRILRDAWRREDLPRGTVATVGNFDGLHRGQQEIVRRVISRARETGLTSVVVTFEPHPLTVLRPDDIPPRLTTLEQRERHLDGLGVDVVLIIHFTAEFARTPARRFVRNLLHQRLDVKELYVGSRFVFGSDREGDLSMLQAMGESFGFEAFGVREVLHRDEPISSTRIRRAVAAGEAEEVAAMLGRPYSVTGMVAKGDGRGRILGWPTINLVSANELMPADGVYAGEAVLESDSSSHRCVTNVGTRPTVYKEYRRLVESYILDFDREIYGEKVEVSFRHRLRDERRFPSLDALARQIGRDVEATRDYFERFALSGAPVETEG